MSNTQDISQNWATKPSIPAPARALCYGNACKMCVVSDEALDAPAQALLAS